MFCLKVGSEWTPSLVAGLRPFCFGHEAPQPDLQQSSSSSVRMSVYSAASMDRHWALGTGQSPAPVTGSYVPVGPSGEDGPLPRPQ